MYKAEYEKWFDFKRELLTEILINFWLRYVKYTSNKWWRRVLSLRYKF